MNKPCKHSRLIDSTDRDGLFIFICCLCGKEFTIQEIAKIVIKFFQKE